MKILKGLLLFIVIAAVALVGIGFVLPDKAHVERSLSIDAPPSTLYAVLNGFHQFNKWSPWAELDPKTVYTQEGPLLGVGASQSWVSDNPSVGSGSQEIVEVVPNQQVKIDLVFGGFDSKNLSTYTLVPDGSATRVTWAYDSVAGGNLMYRYFGLLSDRMIGPDFDKGLSKLKTLVEGFPKADFSDLQVELVETKAQPIVYIAGAANADQAAAVLGAAFAKIAAFMQANELKQAAAPLAITHEFDEETHFWKFDAAVPVDRADVAAPPDGEIKAGSIYAGAALKVAYKGAYAAMQPTYAKLVAYKSAAGLDDNGDSWEQYISDPGNTAEADLVTHIYWPVK